MTYLVKRYHDISCGHRVVGHEGKCQNLHGHNYRIHFTCISEKLDDVGRVVDFSVVKERLCMWVEKHWDHKFLVWEKDDMMKVMSNAAKSYPKNEEHGQKFNDSLVWVPFNPTAENMAEYLVEDVGPVVLDRTGVVLVECTVEETRKCSAIYIKECDHE